MLLFWVKVKFVLLYWVNVRTYLYLILCGMSISRIVYNIWILAMRQVCLYGRKNYLTWKKRWTVFIFRLLTFFLTFSSLYNKIGKILSFSSIASAFLEIDVLYEKTLLLLLSLLLYLLYNWIFLNLVNLYTIHIFKYIILCESNIMKIVLKFKQIM